MRLPHSLFLLLRNNGYLSEEVLDDLLIYRIMYEDAESLSQYLDVSGNLAERIINCLK